MSTDIERQRAERELRLINETPKEKIWRIPPHDGREPVTVAVHLPEVHVTDAEGRQIVISPEQADRLGSKLGNINDWLQHGDEEWDNADDGDRSTNTE